MSRVLGLLVACVVLAIFRTVFEVLIVALFLALLWSFAARPRETLLLITALALLSLAGAQPIACIIVIGVVGVVALANAKAKPQRRMPTTDALEHHSN